MADDQFTDAQLSDGTTLRFKGHLTPEQVRAKVTQYRTKQETLEQARQTVSGIMPAPRETGVLGSLKRLVTAPIGLYRAATEPPALEEERRLRNLAAKLKVPYEPPSAPALLLNRLIDFPAERLEEESRRSFASAKSLAGQGKPGAVTKVFRGALEQGLSAIPFAGPFVSETEKQISEAGDIPGAATDVALAALGARLPKLGRVRAAAVAPEVPLTRAAQATGVFGPAMRGLESVVERSLPGQAAFKTLRQQQQVALLNKADRLVESISTQAPSQAGQAVVKDLADTVSTLKAEGTSLYAEVDKLTKGRVQRIPQQISVQSRILDPLGKPLEFQKTVMRPVETGGVGVSTNPLKKYAVQQLRKLRSAKQVVDPKIFEQAEANLLAVIKAPKKISFEAASIAKSELLSTTRRIDSLVGSRSQGIAKRLVTLLDEEMETAARGKGLEVVTAVNQANSFWREMRATLDRTFDSVSDIARTRPEDAGRLLSSLPLESVADLRGGLRPATWQAVKASWLREGLLNATKGEKLGRAIGLRELGAETLTLNPQKFRNWLEAQGKRTGGMASSRLDIILDATEQAQITELVRIAEKAYPKAGGLVGAIAMPMANLSMLSASAYAIATADASLAGTTIGTAAILWALSKVMTRPGGFPLARNFLLSARDASTSALWGARLVNAANDAEQRERQEQQ